MAYANGYSFRKLYTQAHGLVSGGADLANFPVLISVTDAALKTVGNAGNVQSGSGYDIRFETSGGTKLDHQVVQWSATTGLFVAWVRVSSLTFASDTTFYVYYGNASVVASEENVPGVWDAAAKGVWSLGDGTTLSLADATSNANTGTNHGATAVAGKVSGGANFVAASDQYIDVGTGASLGITGNLTVEAWVKLTSSPGAGNAFMVVAKDSNTGGRAYTFDIYNDAANALALGAGSHVRFYINGGTFSIANGSNLNAGGTVLSTGVFYYLVGVYTTAGTLDVYLNGANDRIQNTGHATTIPTATAPTLIGRRSYAGFENPIDGVIDEVRIAATARSAGWIATTYNAQSSPSTFGTFGSEEAAPATIAATMAIAVWSAAAPAVVLAIGAAFLSIAGIAVPIMEGQAVERIDWRGASYRAFAGNLRAMVRAERLAWQVTTGLMTASERSALESATAFKAHVACAGVGLPGTVTCEVTVSEAAEINTSAADGTGLLYSLALVLRTV